MKAQQAVRTLVVLGFFLCTPAVAQETSAPPLADFRADQAEFSGLGGLQGRLAALEIADVPANAFAPGSPFRLEAQRLRLEVDHQEGPVGTPPYAYTEARTTSSYFNRSAGVEAAAPRSDPHLWLLPAESAALPDVTLQGQGIPFSGGLRGAPTPRVEIFQHVDARQRGRSVADTSAALFLVGRDAPHRLQVQGSFVLSVYNWNLTVTDGETGAREEYFSGMNSESLVDDPTGRTAGFSRNIDYHQLYLFVTNGTLTFPAMSAQWTRVFVNDGSLDLTGELSFANPRGNLLRGVTPEALDANQAAFQGDLRLRLTGSTAQGFHAVVFGRLDEVVIDGHRVRLDGASAPASQNAFLLVLGLFAVSALTAGSGYGGVRLRRRRQLGLLEELEAWAATGLHQEVVRGAEPLLRSRAFNQEAAALKLEALVRLGRPDDAKSFLDTLGDWKGPAGATLEYFHAYVAAHRNDRKEVARRLRRCLAASPEMGREIVREPAFRPLRRDPAISSIFRDLESAHLVGYQ